MARVPATVFEAQRRTVLRSATIPEIPFFSITFTAGSEAVKLEKEELLREVKNLKDELSSRKCNNSNEKKRSSVKHMTRTTVR